MKTKMTYLLTLAASALAVYGLVAAATAFRTVVGA